MGRKEKMKKSNQVQILIPNSPLPSDTEYILGDDGKKSKRSSCAVIVRLILIGLRLGAAILVLVEKSFEIEYEEEAKEAYEEDYYEEDYYDTTIQTTTEDYYEENNYENIEDDYYSTTTPTTTNIFGILGSSTELSTVARARQRRAVFYMSGTQKNEKFCAKMIQVVPLVWKTVDNLISYQNDQLSKELDQDDNGFIGDLFSNCNLNDDKVITSAEFLSCSQNLPEQLFQNIGINIPQSIDSSSIEGCFGNLKSQIIDGLIPNGRATIEEFELRYYAAFKVQSKILIQIFDKNKDGKLELSELGIPSKFYPVTMELVDLAVNQIKIVFPQVNERILRKTFSQIRVILNESIGPDEVLTEREITKANLDLHKVIFEIVLQS